MKTTETVLPKNLVNEDAAREFLEASRWPDGVVCPHCGVIGESYRLQPKEGTKTHVRKGVWKCGTCRKQFTVKIGTIFEDSHIPLDKWLLAIHLLCSSKKNMSAHQFYRMLGLTYKSAWFMAHRIRYAMEQEPLSSKLKGTIEVDETYIGGKPRYSIPQVVKPGERPRDHYSPTRKATAVSVLERGGRVQSKHIERVTAKNLKPIIEEMVAEDAHLMTDDSTVLKSAGKNRLHSRVNHSAKEYARYENGICITTNGAEGCFSIMKRGVNGVYHHWSQRHLHRYLSEFDFRFNTRNVSDVERRTMAVRQTEGKRLMYRDSTIRHC